MLMRANWARCQRDALTGQHGPPTRHIADREPGISVLHARPARYGLDRAASGACRLPCQLHRRAGIGSPAGLSASLTDGKCFLSHLTADCGSLAICLLTQGAVTRVPSHDHMVHNRPEHTDAGVTLPVAWRAQFGLPTAWSGQKEDFQ
jgi:hypothetical protein